MTTARTDYSRAYRERRRLGIRSQYHNALAPLERLLRQVVCDRPTRCWLWTGSRNRQGYGVTTLRGRRHGAYRALYLLLVGPVADGLDLDHLCRNRICVNPAHLEPVTRQENCRRGLTGQHFARRTHCSRGHEYTPANTGRDASGSRVCRACSREKSARHRARQGAAA